MSRRLYGFLDECFGDDPMLMTASGDAVQLAKVARKDDVVLFVSGADVSVLSAPLPVRSEAEARRAAPFAVEDEIAVALEDVAIALGEAGDTLQTPRAMHVVAKETLAYWCAALDEVPALAGARLVAEQSVLADGQILTGPDRYIASLNGRAFSADIALPEGLLGVLLDGHSVDTAPHENLLGVLAEAAEARSQLVDLRQGEFRARASFDVSGLRAWRLSGLLAAALALTWTGASLMEVRALNAETETIQTATRTSYLAVFPEAPRNNDYLRAASNAVRDADTGSSVDFLQASAALYESLGDVPFSELRSIRFDNQRGELVARIAYAGYGDDANLKTILQDAGLTATLGDTRLEGDNVVGDVTIRGAAR